MPAWIAGIGAKVRPGHMCHERPWRRAQSTPPVLMGSIWELAIPALIAVGSMAVYVLVPELRENLALRLILIAAVALTAIGIMIATLILGVFFLSGGMANF